MSSILKVDQLQDSGGNAIISSNGSGTFTSSLPNTGITMADNWRVTTGFTGGATPIASNWERNDTSGVGFIGSAMTESSGVFSFPSTGIYYVEYHHTFSLNSNSRYNGGGIELTTNNSSFAELAFSYTHISNNTSSTTYTSAEVSSIIDVTDTSNIKVRFTVAHHDNNTATTGGSSLDYTYVRFLRLGDT